jgi:YggT family protein
MFVFSTFLTAAAKIIDIILSLYMYVVIGRAIISWVNPDPYNPIVRFLYQATEPVLSRVRRFIPYLGGIDLSPLIVILIIYFLKEFVVRSLYLLAYRL